MRWTEAALAVTVALSLPAAAQTPAPVGQAGPSAGTAAPAPAPSRRSAGDATPVPAPRPGNAPAAGATAPQPAPGRGGPLSGSDWLSGRSAAPPPTSWRPGDPIPEDALRRRGHPPVADTGAVPPVSVTRLSEGNPDVRGTLTAEQARLPRDLWGAADPATVASAIASYSPRLPATRGLLRRMLTAQLDPPAGGAQDQEGRLFLARVDRLIGLGWIDAAADLLQAAGPGDPQRFSRRFDIGLLLGEDMTVCDEIARRPGLAPNLASRIYCLAQAGDWSAAALALYGGRSNGLISPATAGLLVRFLDDSSADELEELPPPTEITPLDFALHEAIGQPLSTTELPLAFAWTDLRSTGGWKARLDSAERLARAGADEAGMLAQAYLEQQPAASGGVWERAAAFQRLTGALDAGDPQALSAELPAAVETFDRAGLVDALARAIADRLPTEGLSAEAAQSAARLRLLAGLPVEGTSALPPFEAWLARVAAGEPGGPVPDGAGHARAQMAEALEAQPLADIGAPSRGLALLGAMADVDAGLDGDLVRAANGLRRMTELGQGADARRAAVQLMLLDRPGAERD